jgi:hypothetical protein
MPGAIPHVIAGCIMYIIGRYHFCGYFNGEDKTKERYLLLLVCLSFGFIPDFIVIIYYFIGTHPSGAIFILHTFIHFIFLLMALVILIHLQYGFKIEREPIWIMGMWSIILHVIMDLFIPEYGIWV